MAQVPPSPSNPVGPRDSHACPRVSESSGEGPRLGGRQPWHPMQGVLGASGSQTPGPPGTTFPGWKTHPGLACCPHLLLSCGHCLAGLATCTPGQPINTVPLGIQQEAQI